MYVIGLTGNIATGKSTVAQMLARLGAEVLDADKLAHRCMRAGTDVNRRIVARFGRGVVQPDGEVDRQALGEIVFADPQALAELEAIVHPQVLAESRRWLEGVRAPVAVIEAIKLLEAGMDRQCDAVWVVTSPPAVQEARLVSTRKLSPEEARQRMAAQPPQEDKRARADVIIDNSGSLDDCWRQVLRAWNSIPSLTRWPEDTPWAPPPRQPGGVVRIALSSRLWLPLSLSLGMALLVLLTSGRAGLTGAQRGWFVGLAAALGLVSAWLITQE